jgi:hypothetical protein
MNRRDLTPTTAPAPRVIHYLDPAPRGPVVLYHPADLTHRRRAEQLAYTRWVARRDAIRQHDRKVRLFWLGFGATTGTALLAGLGWLGWSIYHAAASLGAVLTVAVLALLAGTGVLAGARRCITIVQHWH